MDHALAAYLGGIAGTATGFPLIFVSVAVAFMLPRYRHLLIAIPTIGGLTCGINAALFIPEACRLLGECHNFLPFILRTLPYHLGAAAILLHAGWIIRKMARWSWRGLLKGNQT